MTWDQALFSFPSVNNIPEGKAKRKEPWYKPSTKRLLPTFLIDWHVPEKSDSLGPKLSAKSFMGLFGGGVGDKSSRHLEQASFVFPPACFCAKARLMRVISHQEDNQTWENCGWVAEKKNWNVERFWRSQNLFTGLGNHCFKQQKENQLVITKKNNEPNQKLTKQWSVPEWVQWKCEDGFKILKQVNTLSHFNVISVMVKTSLSHTFHWSVRTCRKPAN